MFKEASCEGPEILEFTDLRGHQCSIRESSLAADAIWLGIDDVEPKVMARKASKVGVETKLSSRMYLNRPQVEQLVEVLQNWLLDGSFQAKPVREVQFPIDKAEWAYVSDLIEAYNLYVDGVQPKLNIEDIAHIEDISNVLSVIRSFCAAESVEEAASVLERSFWGQHPDSTYEDEAQKLGHCIMTVLGAS